MIMMMTYVLGMECCHRHCYRIITDIAKSNSREGVGMTEYLVWRRIFVWGFYGPSQIDEGRGMHQSNICNTDFKLTLESVFLLSFVWIMCSSVSSIYYISLSLGQLIIDDIL